MLSAIAPASTAITRSGSEIPNSTAVDSSFDYASYEASRAEWTLLISQHQAYSDLLDDLDMHGCSFDDLALLITAAPTSAIRHSVREAMQCRVEMMKALGLAIIASEHALSVFAKCTNEWENVLDTFPVYKRWLARHNRLDCSEENAIEAMRRAPNLTIRHAMREFYLFRTTAALHTPYKFD